MRIAYFTTAQESAVFKKFYIERNINVNNSNQIFHSNLIRSLSQNNEVTAFSCRKDSLEEHPSSSKKTGNITWQYLATKKSSFKNLKSQRKEVSNFTKYNDVCFVDTTNLRCILNARKYCKIKKIPLIGIVTDNPKNISNQKGIVSKIISHYIKKCDAYVCLTDSLNLLFNKKKKKPYTIVKGINKGRVSGNKPVDFPYFFYAGTLLKKYGIYDLIDAYKTIKNKDINVTGNAISPANLQIQLATVVNQQGLKAQQGNIYISGANSGALTFSIGNANGFGEIGSGGLELSNVNLAIELANMIVAQRAIDANSRVFSSTSEVLQRLVNLQ